MRFLRRSRGLEQPRERGYPDPRCDQTYGGHQCVLALDHLGAHTTAAFRATGLRGWVFVGSAGPISLTVGELRTRMEGMPDGASVLIEEVWANCGGTTLAPVSRRPRIEVRPDALVLQHHEGRRLP